MTINEIFTPTDEKYYANEKSVMKQILQNLPVYSYFHAGCCMNVQVQMCLVASFWEVWFSLTAVTNESTVTNTLTKQANSLILLCISWPRNIVFR